jgi:ubiquinone/menaquinone biosynthesis C-methylase UbiE
MLSLPRCPFAEELSMSRSTTPRQHPSMHFDDVDGSDDPAARVRFLDSVRSATKYKQDVHDALNLRLGDHVLDVGCGPGDDARAFALVVGPTGHVVGIDPSETMIAEATRRSDGAPSNVEFRLGDACDLPFDDNSFDRVIADRVVQHIKDRERALKEMVRVAKPDGLVAVADPDWESIVIDVPDRNAYRSVKADYVDKHTNGWAGRQTARLLAHAGLTDLRIISLCVTLTDFNVAGTILDLSAMASNGVSAGLISNDQAEDWNAAMREAVEGGYFFASVLGFAVVGRKRS